MKGIRLFGQLLLRVPTRPFLNAVSKHDGEKHAKGFSCWLQLVSMLFCHLARADSLREICNGLASSLGKLTHLGVGVRETAQQLLKLAGRRFTLSIGGGGRDAPQRRRQRERQGTVAPRPACFDPYA